MLPRELVAASVEPLLLALLARGENYGYALIQELAVRSEQRLQWNEGMLYPVLHRLEQKGQITARWVEAENGRKRKYYALRPDGREALARHHEQWSLVTTVLQGLRHDAHARA